jgi:hypothetical protein
MTPFESTRRAPRWGPSRTPRAATVVPLRFGPRRLYPHRGPHLARPEDGVVLVHEREKTRLQTINH